MSKKTLKLCDRPFAAVSPPCLLVVGRASGKVGHTGLWFHKPGGRPHLAHDRRSPSDKRCPKDSPDGMSQCSTNVRLANTAASACLMQMVPFSFLMKPATLPTTSTPLDELRLSGTLFFSAETDYFESMSHFVEPQRQFHPEKGV